MNNRNSALQRMAVFSFVQQTHCLRDDRELVNGKERPFKEAKHPTTVPSALMTENTLQTGNIAKER